MARLSASIALMLIAASCPAQSIPRESTPADSPVALTNDGSYFILSNADSVARIDMHTGELSSLKYHGLETMGYVSGHHAGYWEQLPRPGVPTVTIDPKTNAGDRAEVSVKGYFDGFTLEERYSMGRHDHGLYTYAIFGHPRQHPGSRHRRKPVRRQTQWPGFRLALH